jgi:hypothetical protein
MWIDPIGQKFHADSKNYLKKFHAISEGIGCFELSVEMSVQIFKIVWEKLA